MPQYVYICQACGEERVLLRDVCDRDLPVFCKHDSSRYPGDSYEKKYPMKRVITSHATYEIKGINTASVTPRKDVKHGL